MNKEPVKIIEFDTPVNIYYDTITPYTQGQAVFTHTYRMRGFSGSYFEDWGFTNDIDTSPVNIGSVTVDSANRYIEADTLTDCITQEGSWFADDYVLYIHYVDDEAYWAHRVRYGMAHGYCNREWEHSDGTISNLANEFSYPTKIVSTNDVVRELDIQSTGLFLYNDGSCVLNNADGSFDQYYAREFDNNGNINSQLFGRSFRILRGYDGDDYSDFIRVFSGTVDTYSSPQRNRFQIRGLDNRQRLTKQLPTELLTQTDWPYLMDELDNTYRPVVLGSGYYVKAVPLNTNQTTLPDTIIYAFNTGVTYKTVILGSEIFNAYVDFGDGRQSIDNDDFYVDYDRSLIYINKTAIYDSGLGDIYCLFNAQEEREHNEVIKYLLSEYGDIQYTSSTYDTSTWPSSGTSISVVIYNDDKLTISEALEKIMSCTTDYLTTDGQGRFQYIELSDTSSHTIDEAAIIGDYSIEEKIDEYVSGVDFTYANKGLIYHYDEVDTLIDSYYREKTIEKDVSNISEPSTLAAEILDLRGTIVPTLTMKYYRFDELELGECVSFDIPEALYDGGYKDWNVISIAEMTGVIKLRLRP